MFDMFTENNQIMGYGVHYINVWGLNGQSRVVKLIGNIIC